MDYFSISVNISGRGRPVSISYLLKPLQRTTESNLYHTNTQTHTNSRKRVSKRPNKIDQKAKKIKAKKERKNIIQSSHATESLFNQIKKKNK